MKSSKKSSKKKPKKPTVVKPAVKKDTGRPSDYKSEFCQMAEKLCRLGAIDSELADFFNIAESTLNNWKKEYPEFLESIKKGKIIADAEVADKLFHRAVGYEHEEEKIFCSEGIITRAETIKHYPPETVAAIFWLKNRQKDKWRDKHDFEHNINNLSDEELDKRFKELTAKR